MGLLGLLLVLFLVGSCVRGCSPSQPEQTGDQKAVNSYDSRVSSGASEHLTNEFTPQLNRSEKLAWIAQNADRYADERLPELALLEPEATDFVASVPDSDKKSADYTDSNEVGTYPLVYNWDARWGYVEYAGSNVGVNGSGLAALFMARAGLTGKTDLTPASLAADATSGGYTDETLGTAASFFTGKAADYGVAVKEYTPSGDNLKTILSEGSTSIALVQLKANFTTPYAHWALVVSLNSDGSVSLYDPASASASMRPWAAGTIGANCDGMYQLTRGKVPWVRATAQAARPQARAPIGGPEGRASPYALSPSRVRTVQDIPREVARRPGAPPGARPLRRCNRGQGGWEMARCAPFPAAPPRHPYERMALEASSSLSRMASDSSRVAPLEKR